MLATFTQHEELELEADEARKLAVAIDKVNSLYDFSVIPPSAMAWTQLVMALGSVYGPRAIAIVRKQRKGNATIIPPNRQPTEAISKPLTIFPAQES
jgi:hypothetical protein